MNLLYGEVVAIFEEEGIRFGKILVGGARKKVPLGLLTDVSCGDKVLICDGVAISKVTQPEEENDVPGNSRKAP